MATVSAFGISGTDHLNTLFENEIGRSNAQYAQDLQRDQMLWETFTFGPKAYWRNLQNQRDYYDLEAGLTKDRIWNTTSNQIGSEFDAKVKAYNSLGINPILYADYGGMGSAGGSTAPVLQAPSSARSYDVNPISAGHSGMSGSPTLFASAKEQLRAQKAQADILEAEAESSKANSALDVLKTSAEIEALEDTKSDAPDIPKAYEENHEPRYTGWKKLRDNIQTKLEKEGYTESKARAIAIDAASAAKGIADTVVNALPSARAVKAATSAAGRFGKGSSGKDTFFNRVDKKSW